jgi:hypothetical protein
MLHIQVRILSLVNASDCSPYKVLLLRLTGLRGRLQESGGSSGKRVRVAVHCFPFFTNKYE